MLQDSQDREDAQDEDQDVRKNQVTLMTLHSSKGLEFDIVYLVGMEEERYRTKTIQLGRNQRRRRLLYVGITEREKIIHDLLQVPKISERYSRAKSRFINDLSDANLY
jgi:superfamily I DNA/RNA helicase